MKIQDLITVLNLKLMEYEGTCRLNPGYREQTGGPPEIKIDVFGMIPAASPGYSYLGYSDCINIDTDVDGTLILSAFASDY